MITKIDKVRRLLDREYGTPREIAEKVGCHASQVYHEIARRREEDEAHGMVPRLDPPSPAIPPKTHDRPALLMDLQLGVTAGQVEVKLRGGRGEMIGTLVLESIGVSYRRPNQKAPADRSITWATLDKIMQLGIA